MKKPNRLNLEQMWNLYLLLKPAFDGREQEPLLIDEVDKLINLSTPKDLLECIHIMYDNNIEFNSVLEFSILFLQSIHENDLFSFVEFIRGINAPKQ